ncbi:hypothetical protein OA383_00050 [Candidatus Pelagibacter bacterium]|nr:hypothetical protein [Candidatus Pelagibacter bacterium]
MKKKKKKLVRKGSKKTKKRSSKRLKIKSKKIRRKKNKLKKKRKKLSKKIRKILKKNSKKSVKKFSRKSQKTRALVLSFLRLNDKIKSLIRFNFSLDQSLQNFFTRISKKFSDIKQVIIEEREKQKQLKIKEMEKEKLELQKKLRVERDVVLKMKANELRDEIRLVRERKKDLKQFIREEQAEVRKEQAARQRKFLEQIKLEKKIEKFRQREANEIRALEKFVLSQQRENYKEVEERIIAIKKRYQELRDQKIKERVEQLGISVAEGDDRAILLEKEKNYYLERQKIEYALESFWRSAHSLCFQLNRKYVPKYLSIFRCLDFRMERGEILIKFDDTPDEDWLILIYLNSESAEGNIIIEDKSNHEKNFSKEFKPSEIFQASDMMVESLTQLLDRERNKKKAS